MESWRWEMSAQAICGMEQEAAPRSAEASESSGGLPSSEAAAHMAAAIAAVTDAQIAIDGFAALSPKLRP